MGGINNDPKGRSVPTENGTANKTINDVLGNKNDSNLMGPGLSSLYDLAGFMAYYHVHDSAKVYPDLADPVNVEAAAADWTYGSWVELIPSDTITKPFDIHWVHTAELSNQGNYQLQLGAGSAGNEESIGTIAFSRDSNQVQTAASLYRYHRKARMPGSLLDLRMADHQHLIVMLKFIIMSILYDRQ